MPISNAAFAERIAEVTVDIPESDAEGAPTEPCLVRYRPNVITPNWARQIEREEVGSDRFVDMFCQMVTFMDVVGPLHDVDDEGNRVEMLGDGELVPLRPEYVGLCSQRLLALLLQGVMDDLNRTMTPKGSEPGPVPISSKSSRRGSFAR